MLTIEQTANMLGRMATRGDLLAHSISFALSRTQKVVRGLWKGLTEEERWEVARKTVEHLKEHGDPWRLNEEQEASPLDGAHSTPNSFTEAHNPLDNPPRPLDHKWRQK
jgi:hypothetical protein